MDTWYEISYNYNGDDIQLRFGVEFGNDILGSAYNKIQDDIFSKLIYNIPNKNLKSSLNECLISYGYSIEFNDIYEIVKSKLVPIKDIQKYKINYIKPITPCEGCVYDSPGQVDHMGYYGCLNN